MFIEAFRYLTTNCKSEYRRLGYLHESIALEARYRRLHDAWSHHVTECHKLIRLAVEQCKNRRKLIILGSGILAEIPLQYLSREFGTVVLVDVVHVACVHKKVAAFENVTLIEADITGMSAELLNLNKLSNVLPEPKAYIPGLDDTVDLIISANLLSQIYVGPLNHAVSRTRFSDDEFIIWCQAIIDAHLKGLLDSGSRVCLITDTVHDEINRNGVAIRSEDVLFGVKLPDSAWQWVWQLAPLGEVSPHYSVNADVSGFINFPFPMY